MIVSYVLFVMLFIAASLAWGLVFPAVSARLPGRDHLVLILVAVACGILASVFLLDGIVAAEINPSLAVSSGIFGATFVVTLSAGFLLNANRSASTFLARLLTLFTGPTRNENKSELIDEILERTKETGEIDGVGRELLESIFKFTDKVVREVMIPRGDVVAIDIQEDPRKILRKVIEEGYSRLPVYRNSIDNIVGIIYAKDLLTMVEDGGVIVLQDLLRGPYYVPETKKISQLLRDMQKNRVHLAVVVDEFGGTEGIVTLEDVLEEIVGEIQDEYDESQSELTKDENGDVHLSGSMTVSRFNSLLGADMPEADEYGTMAGFVQKLAGKLPQEGEMYTHDEILFYVEEVSRHRIKRLRVSYREHPFQMRNGEDKAVAAGRTVQQAEATPSGTSAAKNRRKSPGRTKPPGKSAAPRSRRRKS